MLLRGMISVGWTRSGARKAMWLLMTGLALLVSSAASRAQEGLAPTIITLVPVEVTEASATLRAEVNPNGLPTTVEFFVSGHSVGVVHTGTVDAGEGTTAKVVTYRATGLSRNPILNVRAEATNSAGKSSGLDARLFLEFGETASPWINYAHVAAFPVRDVTERAATLEFEIDPRGYVTVLKVFLAYVLPGSPSVDRILVGERKVSGEGPVRAQFRADGLWKGFNYTIYVECHRVLYGGDIDSNSYLQSFSTAGETGRNPPQFANAAMRVPIGSTKSFTKLVEVIDPDGDAVMIESVSQPMHGTVSVEVMEWTYTPDDTYGGSDQFTVTVSDEKGEHTTRVVQIYDTRPSAYEFDVALNWNISEPPRPAGRIKLSTTVGGAFTGKISIFEKVFTFRGEFDRFDEAFVELNRKGLPPLTATLKLVPQLDGELHLWAEIVAPELDSTYLAEGLPVGNAESSEGVAGLQYTAVLPLQDGAPQFNRIAGRDVSSSGPRGDGFLIGRVKKNGRVQFTGRTGDGQTFSVGGRLQRNRKFQVSTSVGKEPRDYIVGQLEFNRDATNSVSGYLGWLSYRSQSEYYSQDFIRVTEPRGAAYRKPQKGENHFGEASGASQLRLRLLDGDGGEMVSSLLMVNDAGKAALSGKNSVKLTINRKSGLFRGTLTIADSNAKSSFSGALVQPLKQGQGQLLLNGPVGGVIIGTPEE